MSQSQQFVEESELDQKIVQLAISDDDNREEDPSLYGHIGSVQQQQGHKQNGVNGSQNGEERSPNSTKPNKNSVPMFGVESPLGFPSALSSPALIVFSNVKNGPTTSNNVVNNKGVNGSTSPNMSGMNMGQVQVQQSSSISAKKEVKEAAAKRSNASSPSGMFVNKHFDPEAECQKCKAVGTVYNKELVRWCWQCCPCVFCGQGQAVCTAGVCSKCYSPLLGERLR
jgi:hypothetical protein